MNDINYEEMTKQIIEGMNKSGNTNSFTKNLIKTEIGSVVLGRFVLYKPSPKNSIYHYYHHGWKTSADKYVSYLCPKTYEQNCPICSKSIQFWKSDNAFLKEASKKIRRKENWMVNFYVIDDNKNPENNGKVKIFRYGQQVKDIVEEAMTGADKDIYGNNIWRLDTGCTFRITVKANSDKKDAWPSYTSSKFLPPSKLEFSQTEIKNILESAHDLTSFMSPLSEEEIAAELQKNFLDDLQREQSVMDSSKSFEMKKTTVQSPASKPQIQQKEQVDTQPLADNKAETSSSDSEIDDLLKELD